MEVRNGFKDNVNSIPWMDSTTKQAVMEKVNVIEVFEGVGGGLLSIYTI